MSLKLMIAPLIATLFLVLLAAVSYQGLSEQKIVIDDLASVRFKTYQDASQMIHRMAIVHKDVFKLLGFADAGADETKIKQLATECLRALDQLKEGVAAAGKAGPRAEDSNSSSPRSRKSGNMKRR
jgi:hypothetical protein